MRCFSLFLIVGISWSTFGAPIRLYNTGVSDSGELLDGGEVDPHYTLTLSTDPLGLGPNSYVIYEGYPIAPAPDSPWMANGPDSKWIGPKPNQGGVLDGNGLGGGSFAGPYRFKTTFDLTGLDPATARIDGQWSTDNHGLKIFLNGQDTGYSNDGNFAMFHPFSLTSGFRAGINELEFVFVALLVFDPTGLRVEMEGTACPSAEAPPYLDEHPANRTAIVGETIDFRVRLDCPAQVGYRYQWRKNEAPLAGQEGSQLILGNLKESDAGVYDVVVMDGTKQTISQSATLVVENPAARLTLQKANPPELLIYGLVGRSYVIEYADSLEVPVPWNRLTSVFLFNSPELFVDEDSTEFPQRFYRARPE